MVHADVVIHPDKVWPGRGDQLVLSPHVSPHLQCIRAGAAGRDAAVVPDHGLEGEWRHIGPALVDVADGGKDINAH